MVTSPCFSGMAPNIANGVGVVLGLWAPLSSQHSVVGLLRDLSAPKGEQCFLPASLLDSISFLGWFKHRFRGPKKEGEHGWANGQLSVSIRRRCIGAHRVCTGMGRFDKSSGIPSRRPARGVEP